MSSRITDTFAQDHHRCDHRLAAAESAAKDGDWALMKEAARELVEAMERHFEQEESSLFPALSERFPGSASPIEVMCSEHAQMRHLFEDLQESVQGQDRTAYLGILETLHFLVQQHNYKEESVLYPMADKVLGGRAGDFAERMADV
ncbi:hemerythrin domain-containing protein [Thiorhodococcus fuscus]|uniref:Hemerythrin domain-containing protein n=1 Tax=Thiorhodococcus fuscus TaxID=527200 RepID=A0ABW4Y3A0_9GAMM